MEKGRQQLGFLFYRKQKGSNKWYNAGRRSGLGLQLLRLRRLKTLFVWVLLRDISADLTLPTKT